MGPDTLGGQTARKIALPEVDLSGLFRGRRLCVGTNRESALFFLGAVFFALSYVYHVPVLYLVFRVVGGLMAAVNFRKLWKLPFENLDYSPLSPVAVRMAEVLDDVVRMETIYSQLCICEEGAVRDVMMPFMSKFSEAEQKRFSYLFNGYNDREECKEKILRLCARDKEELFSLATEIARWRDTEKARLGTGYVEPVVKEMAQVPATATRSVAKRRREKVERITDVEIRIAETVQALAGVIITPNAEPEKGPAVTRYSFKLPNGTKMGKITGLSDDVALALAVPHVRIAPIDGKPQTLGFEVKNDKTEIVKFSDVFNSREYQAHKSPVAFPLGKDISGKVVVGDIAEMPHVLIAGTTGSGKSVCENSLICSIIKKVSPCQVKFIMIDPKMVELWPYAGIPHLERNIVTDPIKAVDALKWAREEMMRRYTCFQNMGVKKISEFNAKSQGKLPFLIVIVDEMADLMVATGEDGKELRDDLEEQIVRIAQMGRAAGVHLVLATQRPTANVVTGLIKANVPTKIAFAVSSNMDSRIILDEGGAEDLYGKGDMFYKPLDGRKIRVQGAYISTEEIAQTVKEAREKYGTGGNGETL